MTRLYFPLRVYRWSILATRDGQTVRPAETLTALGFLPVYDSLEELRAAHGEGCPYRELEQIKESIPG